MTPCSRCGSFYPNSSCYVCAVPEPEEPDAFKAHDDYEFEQSDLERLLDATAL